MLYLLCNVCKINDFIMWWMAWFSRLGVAINIDDIFKIHSLNVTLIELWLLDLLRNVELST